MTAPTLAGGLTALPRPYLAHLTDATAPAQPVIPEDMRHLAADALAALRQASGELPVPELAVDAPTPDYTGCHRVRRQVPADYWPTCVPIRDGLHERIRWYLLASGGTDTGVIPVVEAAR